ncbi:hypothetical protein STEG23_033066 [Scotinomys teguina]
MWSTEQITELGYFKLKGKKADSLYSMIFLGFEMLHRNEHLQSERLKKLRLQEDEEIPPSPLHASWRRRYLELGLLSPGPLLIPILDKSSFGSNFLCLISVWLLSPDWIQMDPDRCNELRAYGSTVTAVGCVKMKLNISFPATGCQKLIEVDDECKLRMFYEKRMAIEVAAGALGEEWKGYVVRISGGNDKQGFPMKQGILTHGRVHLLLSKGHSCYRPRRTGERKRKSVQGCIVDANLSVPNLVIIKKGKKDIPGLTDNTVPCRLGPKRAS